jgi:hypothetical protein
VDLLAEVVAEVLEVTCDQVGGFGGDCSTEDRPVLLGQLDLSPYRLGSGCGLNHTKGLDESIEAFLLRRLSEVPLRLFDGVGGAE